MSIHKRPDRRRDASETKKRILFEAKRCFGERGFSATTVHGVAECAGVSPNLITRYFGGKEGLFLAATQTSLHLRQVLAGPKDGLGRRLSESIVDRWSDAGAEDPLLVLLRSAGEQDVAAAALVDFLDRESLAPVTEQLRRYGMTEAEAGERAASIEAFVTGVVVRRRILADDLGDGEALRRWLASSIQRLVATEGDET